MTPAIVVVANSSVRKPTARQNNRSVPHHPVMRSVETTPVAQPLIMLTVLAAIAVRPVATLTTPARGGTVIGSARWMTVGPVGARRMMLVRGSRNGAAMPVCGSRNGAAMPVCGSRNGAAMG
jgi:hypothetical protein